MDLQIIAIAILSGLSAVFVVAKGKNRRKWLLVSVLANLCLGLFVGFVQLDGSFGAVVLSIGISAIFFLFLLFIDLSLSAEKKAWSFLRSKLEARAKNSEKPE